MRPLRQILATESSLAGLLSRRQSELAILAVVRDSLPPALAAQVGLAAATPPELALAAGSGAAAGLLRQRAPVLLEILRRAGWEFTGIQVRVQARPRGDQLNKTVAKQLDSASVAALRAAASRLADPELAAALQRLAEQGGDGASAAAQGPLDGVEDQ